MVAIRSPHTRKLRTMTGERIANGRTMARMTQRWMENNKDAFFAIYGHVKFLQARGELGRLRDRVAVFCAERGIEVGYDPYKFGNAYWAGIARYMALYDQSLVGAPIKFNDSDIDCYGLLPVSYLPGLGKDYDYEDFR